MSHTNLCIMVLLWALLAGAVVPVAFLLTRQIWLYGRDYLELWGTIAVVMFIAIVVAVVLTLPWLFAYGVLGLTPVSPGSF